MINFHHSLTGFLTFTAQPIALVHGAAHLGGGQREGGATVLRALSGKLKGHFTTFFVLVRRLTHCVTVF